MVRKNLIGLLMVVIMLFANVNIALAAVNNQTTKTLSSVAVNTILVEDGLMNGTIDNKTNGTNLILYPQVNVTSGAAVIIDIILQNAEWLFTDAILTNGANGTYNSVNGSFDNNTNTYTRFATITELPYTLQLSTINKNQATLTIPAGTDIATDKQIIVPLVSKITGNGNVTAVVTSYNNYIQSSTHIYANARSGRTFAEVNDYDYWQNRSYDYFNINKLTIKESQVGTIKTGIFRIVAPSYVTFLDTPKITTEYGLTINSSHFYRVNDYTWEVEINVASPSIIDSALYISDMNFRIQSDYNYDDIEFRIYNGRGNNAGITDEYFKVGSRYGYDYLFKTNYVPTIINGTYNNQYNWDTNKTGLIKVDEGILNSWNRTRELNFNLPDGAKINRLEIVSSKGFSTDLTGTYRVNDRQYYNNVNVTESGFTLYGINWNRTEKIQLEFYLYISTELGYEDEVQLTMTGANYYNNSQDISVIIAKVKNPVTIATSVTDVFANETNNAADFTITENMAGVLKKNTRVEISLYDNTYQSKYFTNDLKIEVTQGDLKISDIKFKDGIVSFNVDRVSSRASVIKFTNAKVVLDDRKLPVDKPIQLVVGGTAIANNYNTIKDLKVDYLNLVKKVVTTVVVTPGVPFYQLNGTQYPMDVEPYFQNDRTMVPLRFVSEAIGATVTWDGKDKATIFLDNKIIQFTFNSSMYTINGVPYYMDCVAEVKDGRTFIPFRYMGEALGANIDWINGQAIYTIVK